MRSSGTKNSVLSQNYNHESDIRYVTKYNSWILTSIGIWPSMLEGSGRFLPFAAILLGNSALCFAVVPCALHIVFEEKDISTKLKLFGLLSFCMMAMVKYCAFALRRPEIKQCIEELKNDWKLVVIHEDRELMLRYAKIGRRLTIICATFMYSGGLIYHMLPRLQYFFDKIVDEYNNTVNLLVYPTYSALFDAQKSPVYELVYTSHCICGYFLYSITVGACGLAALFATHACGQVDIVVSRLKDLVNENYTESNTNQVNRLGAIVEHHLRILRFSAMTEKILQEVCLVEFAGSTVFICLLEYYCITEWENNNALGFTTYVMLLISLTFNIYILCYIGELLMEKTGSIGKSCFMIDWYQLPTTTIRGLILIIIMSGNPVKITAGKMVDLSLATFGNILKTSVAYLSFLRTALM